MIVIHNRLIPLGKARTINFFGLLLTKNKALSPKTKNHEAIHTRQQIEWLLFYTAVLLLLILTCGLSWWWLCTIPFCYHALLYVAMWLLELLLPPYSRAYRDIALERECYENESDFNYLARRWPFAWLKYLFHENIPPANIPR